MHIHASRDITRDIYPEQKTFTPSETLVSEGTETQNSVLCHLIMTHIYASWDNVWDMCPGLESGNISRRA